MITVKRYDFKRTTKRPAYYETVYRWDGVKIAEYNSLKDVIYLDSRKIRNGDGTTFDRALTGKYSHRFAYLFEMLNVDETSSLSEYLDI